MAGASEHKSPNAAEMSANRLPGNAVASESSEDAAAAMNNNNNNSNNSIPATPEAASKAKENLEKVLKLDDELQLMISRRKELEKSIAQIEAQLYNTEKKYLEQTHVNGNLSIGFDGYLQSERQQRQVNLFSTEYSAQDSDCIFSNSSTTLRKSLQLVQELEFASTMHQHKRKKSIVKLSLKN